MGLGPWIDSVCAGWMVDKRRGSERKSLPLDGTGVEGKV